eukprot:SAG22_NODE_8614_length_641_cov_1.241697_1_plen_103_part_10
MAGNNPTTAKHVTINDPTASASGSAAAETEGETEEVPPEKIKREYTEEEAGLLLQIRAKLRASAYFSGTEDWARLFKKVDKDKNGVVDAGELWKAVSIASGGS